MSAELATDIRTIGELVEVLSQLPPNQRVKIMDGEWGYSHYLAVDVVDGEVYLEPNQDTVVKWIWMNGEDNWAHSQGNFRGETLCRLVIRDGISTSIEGFPVNCPWCLHNSNRRRTMMNFSPPPAPYGKET